MGMFDLSGFDPSDPQTAALLGMSQGFAQAAMPSRLPVPFGAALAMGAGGLLAGAKDAQQYRKNQLDLMGSTLDYRLKRDALSPILSQMEGQGSDQTNPPSASGDTQTQPPASAGPSAPPQAKGPTGKTAFDAWYDNYLKGEEGTEYVADDGNGAPARYGINQKADGVDVSKITPDQARDIAYKKYWAQSGANYMNPALAAVQADTAFNMGPGVAWQMLQQSGGDPTKYLALREQRYRQIAQNPDKSKYLPDWLKRNNDLAQYVSGFQPQEGNPQPPSAPSPDNAGAGTGVKSPTDMTGLGASLGMRMLFGGKDRYQTMRNGWAYDTWTNSWTHFPDLGEGVTGKTGPNGEIVASVVPGELGAIGQVEGTKAGVKLAADKNKAGYENFLDTGGAGLTDASGNLKPGAASVSTPAPAPSPAQAPVSVAAGVGQKPARTPQGTVMPPITSAAPINPSEIYLKERIPQWAETENDWNDALPSGVIAEQRALAIAQALKGTQSGAWAEEKADIAANLKQVGINLPASILGDPAKVQEVLKNNFQSTLNQIRAFSSRPAAIEVQLASKNFANPNLQPEANLQIIGETVGTLRWERAMINDWAAAKAQGWKDPQDFQRVWTRLNPIQGFIDRTEQQIGPLKGMRQPSPQQKPASAIPTKPTVGVRPNVQSLINDQSIAETAKKYNVTPDVVKARLRAEGYEVQ